MLHYGGDGIRGGVKFGNQELVDGVIRDGLWCSFGNNHMGAAGGMFFCISEIGGFTGPLIMGVSVDLTGDFLGGALFIALLCLLYVALTLLLKNHPPIHI